MSYREYLKNPKDTLKKYEVYEEVLTEENYSIYKAALKTRKNLQFFISSEFFTFVPANVSRLNQLIACYNHGLLLLEELVIEKTGPNFTLILVAPMPGSEEIKDFLAVLGQNSKTQIFQDLAQAISRLHELEIPYLELSPEKIVYKANKLLLKPFRIVPDFESYGNYCAPEILAGIADTLSQFPADIWSIGCIYAELFISLTPLFESVTPYERLLKMFEILGVPEWKSVEHYMTWETYKGLKVQTTSSLKEVIFKENSEFLVKILDFNPKKRPKINELTESNHRLESSLVLTAHTKSLDKTSASVSFVSQTRDIDNYLNINLLRIRNLDFATTNPQNYVVYVGYEMMLNSNFHVISDNFDANPTIEMNFSQKLPVNSEDFKARYRHDPIIINLYQSIKCYSRKNRENLLGTCEVYIGLLFSSFSSEKSDNSVYGWYNITKENRIIGQILLEINTEVPFNQETNRVQWKSEENLSLGEGSIKDISENLNKLNSFLSEKNIEKENRAKIDDDFVDTLKQLKSLLLK